MSYRKYRIFSIIFVPWIIRKLALALQISMTIKRKTVQPYILIQYYSLHQQLVQYKWNVSHKYELHVSF